LEKNVIQRGPLEHDIFGTDRQLQQITQTIRRIAISKGGNRNLLFGFLNEPKLLVEARPIGRYCIAEIAFDQKDAVTPEPFLQFTQRSLSQKAPLVDNADTLAERGVRAPVGRVKRRFDR